MAEKVKAKVKAQENKRTGDLLSSFVVITILLSVLAASVVPVIAPGPPVPPPPAPDTIILTADPMSIYADGLSISNLTATALDESGEPAEGFTITFTIRGDDLGAVVIGALGDGSSETDAEGTAYAYLTAGTTIGAVEVEAYYFDEPYPSDTVTIQLRESGTDIWPPGPITNLAATIGNFWINWTWTNPTDEDFSHVTVDIDDEFVENVSAPLNYYNATYEPHATKTIALYSVDESGNPNGPVTQTTSIPNNIPVLESIGSQELYEFETVTIALNATDLDYTDTLTYSCNRMDLFANFNATTGAGNWTPDQKGIYLVDFNVSDGYGGIANETVQITVLGYVDLTVEGGKSAEKTVGPNLNATYTLTVSNTGSTNDTFNLTIDAMPANATATLSETVTPELAPNGTYDIALTVSSAIDGDYIVNVTATSQADSSMDDTVMTKTTVSSAPVLVTIEVSPSTVTLKVNDTQQFTATAYDQFSDEMPNVTVTWSVSNDIVGTVNETTGFFEATAAGSTFVTATAGNVTGSAEVTVTEEVWPRIGDMNGDSNVTFDDAIALAKHYYFAEPVYDDPDVNGDGEVTFDDAVLLAKHYYFQEPIYP